MKFKTLKRKLELMGWAYRRTKGSHRIFVHPEGRRNLAIAVHGKDEVDDITAKKVLKNAVDALK